MIYFRDRNYSYGDCSIKPSLTFYFPNEVKMNGVTTIISREVKVSFEDTSDPHKVAFALRKLAWLIIQGQNEIEKVEK